MGFGKTEMCVAKIHYPPFKIIDFCTSRNHFFLKHQVSCVINCLWVVTCKPLCCVRRAERTLYCKSIPCTKHVCNSTCFKSPVIDEPKRPALTLICDSADFCGHLFSHVLLQHTHICNAIPKPCRRH